MHMYHIQPVPMYVQWYTFLHVYINLYMHNFTITHICKQYL